MRESCLGWILWVLELGKPLLLPSSVTLSRYFPSRLPQFPPECLTQMVREEEDAAAQRLAKLMFSRAACSLLFLYPENSQLQEWNPKAASSCAVLLGEWPNQREALWCGGKCAPWKSAEPGSATPEAETSHS